MNLPVRYQSGPGTERVISVDGAWAAPGLNLSHWPGNRTPPELRHDLSTGIALRFSALGERERTRLAQGCTALVNNHFDTDGNCALFAVRHPELALPRSDALLRAAAAGDFFLGSDEQAFAIDCIVSAAVDPERSPIADQLEGLDDDARSLRATEWLFERFPALLDGGIAPFSALYAEELARLREDLSDLGRATRDEIAHLDLCVWTAPLGEAFDPGRHALYRTLAHDRVLVIGPRHGGATYRFVTSTLSWFDLVTRTTLPRASLEDLARSLNELEGTDPGDEAAWRAQDTASPAPELWFGRAELERFSEHCPALLPSRLAPKVVRHALAEALRAALLLPQ